MPRGGSKLRCMRSRESNDNIKSPWDLEWKWHVIITAENFMGKIFMDLRIDNIV